jgi:hypothetical protein
MGSAKHWSTSSLVKPVCGCENENAPFMPIASCKTKSDGETPGIVST